MPSSSPDPPPLLCMLRFLPQACEDGSPLNPLGPRELSKLPAFSVCLISNLKHTWVVLVVLQPEYAGYWVKNGQSREKSHREGRSIHFWQYPQRTRIQCAYSLGIVQREEWKLHH